jgi:catechol 2,3-dioxygenase-like lactoylglutathione lyase family enzyme
VSRVQLALNVTDLDAAVEFYSRLFATEPAKRRPGYANFAIADPPLKLVLFQGDGRGGTINHLGVEVESTEAVAAAQRRLAGEGLATATEEVTCCFALQDKVWVDDPDGAPWEVYAVLSDVEQTPPCSCALDGVDADAAGRSTSPLRTVEPGSSARCC